MTEKVRKLPREPQVSWTKNDIAHCYIADYKPLTSVDGEGYRCAVYLSGCLFECPECFNQLAQNFRYGQKLSADLLNKIGADLARPYVAGISLLGGEPFLNAHTALKILEVLPEGKDVWVWTGYTYEWLMRYGSKTQKQLLSHIDVLVDGPFLAEKRSRNCAYRGSTNQRILHLKDNEQLPIDLQNHSYKAQNNTKTYD